MKIEVSKEVEYLASAGKLLVEVLSLSFFISWLFDEGGASLLEIFLLSEAGWDEG